MQFAAREWPLLAVLGHDASPVWLDCTTSASTILQLPLCLQGRGIKLVQTPAQAAAALPTFEHGAPRCCQGKQSQQPCCCLPLLPYIRTPPCNNAHHVWSPQHPSHSHPSLPRQPGGVPLRAQPPAHQRPQIRSAPLRAGQASLRAGIVDCEASFVVEGQAILQDTGGQLHLRQVPPCHA